MLAAREGYIEHVRALLDAGADIQVEDSDGWTALKYALDNSHHDVAALLKAYGAFDVDN
jgi:ankyrin repeat protein